MDGGDAKLDVFGAALLGCNWVSSDAAHTLFWGGTKMTFTKLWQTVNIS